MYDLLIVTYGSHLHITKTILPRQCSIILREGAASVEWLLVKPVNGESIRPVICLERDEIDRLYKRDRNSIV